MSNDFIHTALDDQKYDREDPFERRSQRELITSQQTKDPDRLVVSLTLQLAARACIGRVTDQKPLSDRVTSDASGCRRVGAREYKQLCLPANALSLCDMRKADCVPAGVLPLSQNAVKMYRRSYPASCGQESEAARPVRPDGAVRILRQRRATPLGLHHRHHDKKRVRSTCAIDFPSSGTAEIKAPCVLYLRTRKVLVVPNKRIKAKRSESKTRDQADCAARWGSDSCAFRFTR